MKDHIPKEGLNQEFYDNGNIKYQETIKFISKRDAHKFENVRGSTQLLIRVGLHAKYDKKGKILWSMTYLANGKMIHSYNKHNP